MISSGQKTDYIIFSDDPSGTPTSSMHLARQLAQNHRVFWVNTYTRMPSLTLHDIRLTFSVLCKAFGRKKIEPSTHARNAPAIHYFTPLINPSCGVIARWMNRWIGPRFLKKLFRDYSIVNPVLLPVHPCAVDLISPLKINALRIYYCVDEWSLLPEKNAKKWAQMESEMLACVDGVCFTSLDLMARKKGNLPSLYFPHAVDYDHFNPSKSVETVPHLETLPKPIIGFFGVIHEWVDVQAIEFMAKRFPHCSFVLLGISRVDIKSLITLPNVHAYGFVPYKNLPSYSRYFDVGLIPFVMNNLTKAVNPLKLFEYYALGLPVISSKLPDIVNVKGPIFFASTHEEFAEQLMTILAGDSEKYRQEAKRYALENSWMSRCEDFIGFVQSFKIKQYKGFQ